MSDDLALEVAVEGVKECFPQYHAKLSERKNKGILSWPNLYREGVITMQCRPKEEPVWEERNRCICKQEAF
jgi:hypothetical protein